MFDVYADHLRDQIILQQNTLTDDNGGGQTSSWSPVLPLRCRVTQLSATVSSRIYQREGAEDVYRVYCEDKIVRTDGERSLHRLLRKPSEAKFRFLWQGDRTITPIGMERPAAGTHDHLADVIWIDCLETPEGVGYADL